MKNCFCAVSRSFVVMLCFLYSPVFAQSGFSAGGFLKLHGMLGDITSNTDQRGDYELFVPHIPVPGGNPGNETNSNWHARTSRLWLRAVQSDTPVGNIELMVEGDLFKEIGSYHPRLRHAYLLAGPVLAGKTWSTFVNASALADIDSGTAVGNMVTRQHQLRYTRMSGQGWQWQLAVETPLNRLHFEDDTQIVAYHYDSRPDIVGRVQTIQQWGNLSLSTVWRELSADAPWTGSNDNRQTLAFSLAGRINFGVLDNLRFMLNHGKGLARYSTIGTYADAVVGRNGNLGTLTGTGALVALQHYWTPQWRSTFAWSRSLGRLPERSDQRLTANADSLHFNLIWAPGTRYSLGAEYLQASRDLLNGQSGEIRRLQLTFRLNY